MFCISSHHFFQRAGLQVFRVVTGLYHALPVAPGFPLLFPSHFSRTMTLLLRPRSLSQCQPCGNPNQVTCSSQDCMCQGVSSGVTGTASVRHSMLNKINMAQGYIQFHDTRESHPQALQSDPHDPCFGWKTHNKRSRQQVLQHQLCEATGVIEE